MPLPPKISSFSVLQADIELAIPRGGQHKGFRAWLSEPPVRDTDGSPFSWTFWVDTALRSYGSSVPTLWAAILLPAWAPKIWALGSTAAGVGIVIHTSRNKVLDTAPHTQTHLWLTCAYCQVWSIMMWTTAFLLNVFQREHLRAMKIHRNPLCHTVLRLPPPEMRFNGSWLRKWGRVRGDVASAVWVTCGHSLIWCRRAAIWNYKYPASPAPKFWSKHIGICKSWNLSHIPNSI